LPEPLLAILKLCALALLYLFFLRVLRAVWAEVSPARMTTAPPAPARSRARGAPARPKGRTRTRRGKSAGNALVVVEPAATAGTRHPLGDEVTVGRAAGCTVTLEDNYVSQLHARVFRKDDAVFVEDLGSTNGTYVNGQKLTGTVMVKRGDLVRIGSTVLEVDP
jgi:pSer/pThr/pTyr-binding forkhead associated (FHA) protein